MSTTQLFYSKKLNFIDLALVVTILLSLAACTPQAVPTPGPTGEPIPSTASETGGYDEFVQALEAAGHTVEPAGSAQPGFFDLESQVIKLNGADVQVMEFPDEAARQAAAATISPDGTQIGNSIIRWMDQPHFWGQGRLIVLYVGTDQAVIEALTGALGSPIAG